MLAGEAGIGKTWIAREVAREAGHRGAVVLWGSCLEGDWQPPYGPWAEALGDYLRVGAPGDLRPALGPGAAALARIVPEIRSLLPDTPSAPPISPNEERLRLYAAVTEFLLSLSRQAPVLLVLDDLHWADRDSLGLLRNLVRSLPRSRILVVGAYRDAEVELTRGNPLADSLAALHREAAYQHVAVRGLAQAEVAEYLAHWAGQALPGGLVEAIYAETGGNPFYVREVFRHLLEEHKILQRAGRWSTDLSLDELGIPEGVRRVVERRVAGLSEETGRMLRLATAFKGAFAFSALRALLDISEDGLLGCLDEALAAGLLCVSEEAPPRYDFAHAIVRQTLYDRINPDRRTRLHRRIALALLRVHAGHETRHAAAIAAQYHASLDLPGAEDGIPYALTAAEEASAGYAHERAVVFLRVAHDLAAESNPATRASIMCKLAIAEARALKLTEARQTAEEALTALSETGAEAPVQAAFLAEVARALKNGGTEPAILRPLVERGLHLLGERRDLAWARLMLLRDPFDLVPVGAMNAMRWRGHDPLAIEIARERGDEDDYVYTLDPLERRSPAQTQAVLALARNWRRPTAVLRALDVVGRDLLKGQGNYREAANLYLELLDASERYGSIPGQGEALMQLAIIQTLLGEFNSARQTAERAQEILLRLGPAHELRGGTTALASLLNFFLDTDWPQAIDSAARYAATPASLRNPRTLVVWAYDALGNARMARENEARRLLASFTPVLEQMEATTYVHHAAIALGGSAVWEIGAVDFAAAYRRMAFDLIRAGFGDNTLPHEQTIARMAALLGDITEAAAWFARARQKAETAGLRPIRAIADYDEALALVRACSTDQTHIQALLSAALASFESLGMDGWARRALSLKGRLATMPPAVGGLRHPDGLTAREVDVLRLIASGKTNREIAEVLVLSPRTVEQHIAHIYGKIGARGRADATSYALLHSLAQPDLK